MIFMETQNNHKYISWTQKKGHSFLIFTMLPKKPFLKLSNNSHNSRSNGHLASFDALINVHVICPTAELLSTYWQWLSGIELKIFSQIQRRKYDTIVNIFKWTLSVLWKIW